MLFFLCYSYLFKIILIGLISIKLMEANSQQCSKLENDYCFISLDGIMFFFIYIYLANY
jgi:hypothetical protein